MTQPSVGHATFVISRVLDAPLPKVFDAWIHPERWDVAGDNSWDAYQQHEFRTGGRRLQTFGPRSGRMWREEGRYEDIVPDKRIVYSYAILRGEVRVTVSLQTLEFAAQGASTQMQLTEQMAILDRGDTAAGREGGVGQWLEKFAASLKRSKP